MADSLDLGWQHELTADEARLIRGVPDLSWMPRLPGMTRCRVCGCPWYSRCGYHPDVDLGEEPHPRG